MLTTPQTSIPPGKPEQFAPIKIAVMPIDLFPQHFFTLYMLKSLENLLHLYNNLLECSTSSPDPHLSNLAPIFTIGHRHDAEPS